MSSTAPALAPVGVGDILDRVIRLYRQNFVALVSIVAVVSVPLLLIQVLGAALALPWTSNQPPPAINDGMGAPHQLV